MYNDKQLFVLVTGRRLCYASDNRENVVAGLQGLCVLGYQEFLSLLLSLTDQVQISCDRCWFILEIIPQTKPKKPNAQSEAVCVENLTQKILNAPGKQGKLHSCIFSGV